MRVNSYEKIPDTQACQPVGLYKLSRLSTANNPICRAAQPIRQSTYTPFAIPAFYFVPIIIFAQSNKPIPMGGPAAVGYIKTNNSDEIYSFYYHPVKEPANH